MGVLSRENYVSKEKGVEYEHGPPREKRVQCGYRRRSCEVGARV